MSLQIHRFSYIAIIACITVSLRVGTFAMSPQLMQLYIPVFQCTQNSCVMVSQQERAGCRISGETRIACCVYMPYRTFFQGTLFAHLKRHLKTHKMVTSSYKGCGYRTNVYSLFNAHRVHGQDPNADLLV